MIVPAKLNLVRETESHYKYKINKYPDGQKDIVLLNKFMEMTPVEIKSHFNSWSDLEIIICATKALRNLGHEHIELYVPYMLGGRSDRRFSVGGVNYIKDVIAPLINAQDYKKVTVLDPHSDVIEACINKLEKKDMTYYHAFIANVLGIKWGETSLLSPDAGALKKVYDVATTFQVKQIFLGSKHRNIQTGKVDHTSIADIESLTDEDTVLIIDDICDGGRTFIELAKIIRAYAPKCKLVLVISHGIFSAGFAELGYWFDKIFTTNSVKDVQTFGVPGELVHQFNVF